MMADCEGYLPLPLNLEGAPYLGDEAPLEKDEKYGCIAQSLIAHSFIAKRNKRANTQLTINVPGHHLYYCTIRSSNSFE